MADVVAKLMELKEEVIMDLFSRVFDAKSLEFVFKSIHLESRYNELLKSRSEFCSKYSSQLSSVTSTTRKTHEKDHVRKEIEEKVLFHQSRLSASSRVRFSGPGCLKRRAG